MEEQLITANHLAIGRQQVLTVTVDEEETESGSEIGKQGFPRSLGMFS
ncbi:hypothetical protein ABID29_001237 [Streptococcus rupicaprae]|uniref:Uncharacterized protein n=1 Tax=Streptococcus rupicaprae TaxID=759619 RepID=A0ABV2FHT6_9STRE